MRALVHDATMGWLACVIVLAAAAGVCGAEEPPALPILPRADEPLTPSGHVAFGEGFSLGIPVDVEGEQCPVFYRQRPTGHKRKRRKIMLENRMSEPEWYRYYRCRHFGFHPTQWHAWPDGWLDCRAPTPGPHPYDLKPPMHPTPPKPLRRKPQ